MLQEIGMIWQFKNMAHSGMLNESATCNFVIPEPAKQVSGIQVHVRSAHAGSGLPLSRQ